jgi:ribosomal protein L11 methyltransferase
MQASRNDGNQLSFPQACYLDQGASGIRHRKGSGDNLSINHTMPKQYINYKIFTQPFNPELITGVLWEFNLLGLIQEEDSVIIYLNENTPVTESIIKSGLEKLKKENLIESFSIEKEILEEKNWNELWEKSREVIHVTERLAIKPSFKDYTAKAGEIVLTIDPKMSFGTGEHQTTKLVLQMMEKLIKDGMKVLDVGSGTGILSIAALKLGAAYAVAIDTDEVCYKNCEENCELNSVTDNIKILTSGINDVQEYDFDLIVANIQKDVLLDISNEIKKRLSKNKTVILSGLLQQNFDEIVNRYSQTGFNLIDKTVMDEWIALAFQLSSSR